MAIRCRGGFSCAASPDDAFAMSRRERMWKRTPSRRTGVVPASTWLLKSSCATRSAHATTVYSMAGVTSSVSGFVLFSTSSSYVSGSVASQSAVPVVQNCFGTWAPAFDGRRIAHSDISHSQRHWVATSRTCRFRFFTHGRTSTHGACHLGGSSPHRRWTSAVGRAHYLPSVLAACRDLTVAV